MPSPFPRHGVWRTYTTLDGLPSLHLHAIAEDREGYLWLATLANGLCRFDGEEFRTFTTRDGLPGNCLYALLQDRPWRCISPPGWRRAWSGRPRGCRPPLSGSWPPTTGRAMCANWAM